MVASTGQVLRPEPLSILGNPACQALTKAVTKSGMGTLTSRGAGSRSPDQGDQVRDVPL